MRMSIIVAAVAVIFASRMCSAGSISGFVTKLEGEPRKSTRLIYRVTGRQVNSNQRYEIKAPTETSTNELGRFEFSIPDDRYRIGTKEVFVLIKSPDLQSVELEYLLGTTSHDVTIVMRKAVHRATELTKMALYGKHGAFHLAGSDATAFYYISGSEKPQLTALMFIGQDDGFLYYDERHTERRWAIAKREYTVCLKCRRGWISEIRRKVWTRVANEGWREFDRCRLIKPDGEAVTVTFSE